MNAPQAKGSVVGDNAAPDYAREVTDRMAKDYAELAKTVTDQLDEARDLPTKIEDGDESMLAKFAALIKRLRDTAGRIDSHHKKEKEPYLRGGQAVDQFFFALGIKLQRAKKADQPGAVDILMARFDDYMQRKLAAEQLARQRELDRLAAEEEAARVRAAAALATEEEARAAAERARKPEKIEEKTAIANEAAVVADSAKVDVLVSADKTDAAELRTKASAPDMTRTRLDGGAIGTMATEKFAEVVDKDKLDKDKLWPHISLEAIEKALRGYAATTSYKVPMDGANIGTRAKARVR